MELLDLDELRSAAQTTFGFMETVLQEQEVEMSALQQRHRTVRGEMLRATVAAVIDHNQACRQHLLAAMIGDGRYWCPLRKEVVDLEPGGPFRFYHEAIEKATTRRSLYFLPSRAFDVLMSRLVPDPFWTVVDVEEVPHYDRGNGLVPVPAEAEIVDIFYSESRELFENKLPASLLADQCGTPPRLKIVRVSAHYEPLKFSLRETKRFPVKFDQL